MDDDPSTLDRLAQEIATALQSLRGVLASDEAMLVFVREQLGFDAPDALAALGIDAATVDAVVQAYDDLGDALGADQPDTATVALRSAALLLAVATATRAVAAAGSRAAQGLDPAFLNATKFAEELPRRLLDWVVVERFEATNPVMLEALRVLDVLVVEPVLADPASFTTEHVHRAVQLDQLVRLVTDPGAWLAQAYGWGTDHPSLDPLLRRLFLLAMALQIPVELRGADLRRAATLAGAAAVDPARPATPAELRLPLLSAETTGAAVEAGLALVVLPPNDHDREGLALLPFADGQLAAEIELDALGDWVAGVTSSLDLQAGFGVLARPGRGVRIVTDLDGAGAEATGTFEARVERRATADPVGLVTFSGDSGVFVSGVEARAAVSFDAAQASELLVEAGVKAAVVRVHMGEADGFLRAVVPGLELTFDAALGVSTRRGVYFVGGAGLELSRPIAESAGPVRLQQLRAAIRPAAQDQPPGGRVLVGLDVALQLGPVTAVAQGIGAQLVVAQQPGGNLGPVDLAVGFKPPDGLGLSLDAGIVSGGGFLAFDAAKSTYAGALELQVGTVGVKALGELTTGKDWSLLLMLYADLPPIQLSFGFMLEGIGGLIGLQRGVDVDQLIAGMKTKAFDDILFPDDPVGDAPRILGRLRTLFPSSPRSLTIGPMIDIGWGTPRILFARVALLVEVDNVFGGAPGPIAFSRVVLVGSLRVEIGAAKDDPDVTVVHLVVDVLGFWEAAAKRYGFLADLRADSRIAFIDITGGLGVWGEYGDRPRFLLAAGGFNPRFKDVPAQMSGAIDRLGAAFDVGRFHIRLAGYLALTPATIQAGMDLAASGKIGPVGVKGEIGFDVLVYLDPYTHFIADFRITAEVTYKGHTLAGVKVAGTVEGPGLWHLTGKVTFSILWWDISKSFDESWGEAPALAAPPTDVQALLAAELDRSENWSAQLPAGSSAMVTLAPPPGDLTPLAHPLGRFVFSQRVVPFGLALEKYGNGGITGPNLFDVASVTLGGAPAPPRAAVREHFARAQFVDMTEDEKLTRPSFEEMDAGVEFSSDAFHTSANALAADMEYETAYLDITPDGGTETRRDPALTRAALQHDLIRALAAGGAAGRAPQRAAERMAARTVASVALSAPPLAAADRAGFAADPAVRLSGQAASVQMIAEQRFKPADAARSQLVERFELAGA